MASPRELWAKAPANLITDCTLTVSALRVYLWLDLRAGQRGFWYGAQREIQDALSLSRRAVVSATAQLRECGYITTDRKGQTDGVTTYRIAARLSTQARIPDGSVAQIGVTGRARTRATDDTHLFNHRSKPRSNKRNMLKPQTDWDQNRRSMDEKIEGLIG